MAVICKTNEFSVKTGTIGIGDPCYGSPSVSSKSKNGKWVAHVEKTDQGSWGSRIASLIIHHEDFNPAARMNIVEDTFFVDSGQAGVFDGDYDGESDSSFYDACCRVTLGKEGYGCLKNGFVSSSGFGDGCYPCVIYKEGDKAVCVEITFIEKN